MSELTVLRAMPTFPANTLGLQRGSMLRCVSEDVEQQLGIPVGVAIPIGFDGEYIRCGCFTWSIEQLEQEINEWKVWKVEDPIDLTDPSRNEKFMREVEHISIITTTH